MRILSFLTLLPVLAAPVASVWAQQNTFDKVKVRFNRSDKDRRLVDKDAVLVFDDVARKLTVRNEQRPLEVDYDSIDKVVFDVSHHMRGGAMGAMVGALGGVGALAAEVAIEGKGVNDYWFFLAYRDAEGKIIPYMLEVDKESSPQVIEKTKALLGSKVQVAEFSEQPTKIDKKTLKDLNSKHKLKVDKQNHPLPEIHPDKALVVVVCPASAARFAGKGIQYKVHANDQVIAVNKEGTYSFHYLDPGEYQLVSQASNASGFTMQLEAGKEYYFLQNKLGGWRDNTSLSRQSKELVMYELSGAYYSDWASKR